ncbi:MAG: glycosyl transferase [Acidimicrobiales bacterium]|nr:glycosyl transferase [Acidimicrobiales bacterium]
MSITIAAPPSTEPPYAGPPCADPPTGEPATPSAADTFPVDDRSGLQRLLRGPADDPAWVRPSLLALLVATGVLYMWGLGASGWANSFYSAAVQAGTKSWKAFFFGSSDASNFITVDKPPAALWVMEISARIFGVNAWSILVPQALEGVAAVGLLYATIRRWFSPAAGLIAGAVMALTPVAVLMFRFNNPDALLVLLLVAAAYALTRAIEGGATKWLVAVGVLIGFGFLTKMLQAFVVVPGFAVTYLIAGPPRLRKRLGQLLVAGAAMFAGAGWWVAIVELVPASWRPYVGGSTDNSVLNLIFGYNGLGRVTGNETGSVGGGAAGNGTTGMWGATGWLRMFNSEFGGQASWLIPAALVLGGAGLIVTIRKHRTDRSRAALLLAGSWLVVTATVFSLSKGIIHPYYTVALAPAIGALVGIGGHLLWKQRSSWLARGGLAAAVLVSAWWAYVLLDRTPNWHPVLRWVVVVSGVIGAAALLAGPTLGGSAVRRGVATLAVAASLVAGLAGPAAYAIDTASTTHSGSLPTAGPTVAGGRGGFPGGGRGAPGGGAIPGGGNGGARPNGGNGAFTLPAGGNVGGAAGGGGGLLDASTPSAALVTTLQENAGQYTWVLATIGANNASGYQLASGDPVMAIGGFNGTDPTPTLAAFQGFVSSGQIHYFVAGRTGGNSADATGISTWVEANFKTVTVGSTTLYDLTQPLS